MTIFGNEIEGKNVVIIGWPTSGKTYLANFLAPNFNHVVIHTDDYIERVGDFKQELYVLLDDLKAIDRPVMIEGILAYRLLRKGVELNCFYPHLVIELETTLEQMQKIYLAERKPHNYGRAKGIAAGCEKVLNDYRAMVNPSPPTWIKIQHKQFGHLV